MPALSKTQEVASFAKNSKALDDSFVDLLNDNSNFILDVLANDLGGQSKVLWSLDEGSGTWNEPTDLLSRDNPNNVNYSQLGAQISITVDGKISYAITPELQSKLKELSIDEDLTDTFIYAMKVGQGNSPLNRATATVKLSGLNHAPELTGTASILSNGTKNTDYTILASDLLKGFTDADSDQLSVKNLTATHGSLTETSDGWLFSPENNFAGKIELSYDIVDSHGESLSATQSFALESILSDTTAPLLTFSEPTDNATEFPVNNNIVLHFDEVVAPGTGNIVISNGTDTRLIAASDTNQVTFSGSKVTINPSTNLIPNTTYNVQIASGVITDSSGNSYSGINDPSALNFTTIPDTLAPVLFWNAPSDNQAFKIDDNIVFGFNEEIKAGTGNIIISNGSDTRTIAINDPSQVTISNSKNGNTVTINPSEDLTFNSAYNIQIASGVITDISGNAWEGINDDTTLNFTTINSDPLLSGSNPWDDSADFQIDSNIELYFDEAVKVGSTGNIVISNGSDTRTIAIDDDSQITFDGYSGVIINPTTDLILGANYSVMIDNGAITDLAGNPYAGINDDTTLNFTTISSNPLLTGSNPPDNSANLQVDGNIELYFNEAVKPGNTGNIVISNGSDTRTIAISDTSQVSFDGYSGVIINSTADLIPGTNYSVKIDSGAITDLAGNTYAGISNDTSLNFTTISTDPRLSGSNPWDDTEFQIDHNIELYFNEMVKAGNTGNIVISNGSDTRTIAIDDASQVTFDGYSDVIINPAADLIPNTNYSIKIDSGAITDLAGNTYAGINDDTSLNFTTISTDPRLSGSNPWDDSEFQIDHNIELYFNEMVKAGSTGNIVISNGSDTRTIAINDHSQVTFDVYNRIVINPTADLIPGTDYSVKIGSGAITDLAGNAYAGISDDTTLNFTTIPTNPILAWSNPGDDSTNFQVDSNIALYFDETVKAGSTGNIVISNGSDTRTIAIDDASQVTFDGSSGVIINPAADLIPNTNYSVKIDSGAIIDLAGNTYAGISNDTALNFSTITSNPVLTSSTPTDDATGFAVDSNIALNFSEAIIPASGNIVISNGFDTRTISINDTNQVTFSGSKYGNNQIIINPSQNLIPNTTYHIRIDESAITDTAGNGYAGISDDTMLNFTTTDYPGSHPINPDSVDSLIATVTGVVEPHFTIL